MFYRQNVPAGYDLSLCMVCGNGAQTIKRDNILVQQRSKCYHTMRVKDVGNTGPVEIAYEDTTVRKVYGSGFNDFFINTDPSVCPIQQCRLLNANGKSYKNNDDNQIV
jgi:hypothetical protein